ncbi:aminotransferase class IV [Thermodesulforhabdus norvegica]|uniref:Branched-chain amino acid aminotransferase n=1 Tax=Thermodesulforhabdus norvegica TaxID=39841 RepID=A0A1I4U881_9BACT|nr:aminotransferase class IV [Thermodesulforhabdus norvegica]SFM85147.1 branched-chain amino acid aminotransferase [Thermodesulforhabdus norvegica]
MNGRDLIVWWNGRFEHVNAVRISPLDRGLQYGDGLFETVRVEKGRALFLEEHLNRLAKSLEELRINPNLPELRTFLDAYETAHIVHDLIRRNGLEDRICRLKIIVTRGVADGLGLPEATAPTVIMMVFPYNPPNPEEYEVGWKAITLRHIFTPFCARYKTLNYLVFLMAREEARRRGAQEALLVDREEHLAEGAASSLLAFKDGFWIEPVTSWKLPGVTIAKVIEFLKEMGEKVSKMRFSVEDLRKCDTLWITNSMIGVMPLSSVDDRKLPDLKAGLAEVVRNRLFS